MRTFHAIYQERAYLRRGGHRRIDRTLRVCARLYNAGLEHWKTAYRYGHSVTLYEQFREITRVRADDEFWGGVGLCVARGVLRRLERARQAFYRRCGAGQTPGYPKYRASRRYRTVEIANPTPGMITNRRGKWVVRVRGLPILVLRPVRGLPDPKALRTLTITRRPNGGYVSLGYAVEQVVLPATDRAVGLDMGVASRIALSDGTFVGRRETDREQVVELQRSIARCKKNSGGQRRLRAQFARLRHRESVRNRNECHRITTGIVRNHDLIAIEDLGIVNMTRSARGTVERPGRNVAAKSGLNRSISEQSWGIIAAQLAYKSEWYGRTLVRVDPKRTSQICSGCGSVNADYRRAKRYECGACGLRMDAETNAALNILARGLSATGAGTPPASWPSHRQKRSLDHQVYSSLN